MRGTIGFCPVLEINERPRRDLRRLIDLIGQRIKVLEKTLDTVGLAANQEQAHA